jgi:hypothetical protein
MNESLVLSLSACAEWSARRRIIRHDPPSHSLVLQITHQTRGLRNACTCSPSTWEGSLRLRRLGQRTGDNTHFTTISKGHTWGCKDMVSNKPDSVRSTTSPLSSLNFQMGAVCHITSMSTHQISDISFSSSISHRYLPLYTVISV